MLAHARLDGLDQVPVPFAERYVHAWQRGAPEHDMDVNTLIGVIKARFGVLYKLVCRPACAACGRAPPRPRAGHSMLNIHPRDAWCQ